MEKLVKIMYELSLERDNNIITLSQMSFEKPEANIQIHVDQVEFFIQWLREMVGEKKQCQS